MLDLEHSGRMLRSEYKIQDSPDTVYVLIARPMAAYFLKPFRETLTQTGIANI